MQYNCEVKMSNESSSSHYSYVFHVLLRDCDFFFIIIIEEVVALKQIFKNKAEELKIVCDFSPLLLL